MVNFEIGDIVEIVIEFYDVDYKYFRITKVDDRLRKFVYCHKDLPWEPEEIKLAGVPNNPLSRAVYPEWEIQGEYLVPKLEEKCK